MRHKPDTDELARLARRFAGRKFADVYGAAWPSVRRVARTFKVEPEDVRAAASMDRRLVIRPDGALVVLPEDRL